MIREKDSTKMDSLHTNTESLIKHTGYVSMINGEHVEISLEANINCAACNAKAACGVSDEDVKIVEVHNNTQQLKINERVAVVMEKSLGMKAVFWGYIAPFILMFSVLIISSVYVEEWIAGLLALFVLAPYYLLLYYNQKTMKKIFTVRVIKNK